ncbi:MAG TPA: divalent-cation tolerance protein CutA [Noviherbaspirillum sp.]|nr:divalent-cation tolerance protein CutA [Noviherbaspirillum sp.]
MDQALIVFVNVPDEPTAHSMARALVEARLAACVNVLPEVRSVYRWQGKLEEASEVTILIKTTQARYADLQTAVKAAHPYDVPELIALPIVAGLPEYLGWVAMETKKEVDV